MFFLNLLLDPELMEESNEIAYKIATDQPKYAKILNQIQNLSK